jgi:hypothetical protein
VRLRWSLSYYVRSLRHAPHAVTKTPLAEGMTAGAVGQRQMLVTVMADADARDFRMPGIHEAAVGSGQGTFGLASLT